MKASDLFGVVVRTFGLFILLRGIWFLWWAFLVSIGAVEDDPLTENGSMNEYVIGAIGWILLGLVLLRGASWVVRFTYHATDFQDLNPPPSAE